MRFRALHRDIRNTTRAKSNEGKVGYHNMGACCDVLGVSQNDGYRPTSRRPTKTLRLMNDLRFTSAITVEGRFVRQRGGRHHFGEVILTIEASDTPGATYSWEVSESQIPSMFQQATFNGIQAWFREGSPLNGYELRHTNIRVVGGSHHEIDSNELSYTYAATNAFALAVNTAGLLTKPLVSPFQS